MNASSQTLAQGEESDEKLDGILKMLAFKMYSSMANTSTTGELSWFSRLSVRAAFFPVYNRCTFNDQRKDNG